MTREELDNRFNYHAPVGGKAEKHNAVRIACKDLAQLICEVTKASREQSSAITRLEEVMFWANAAIARLPEKV